MKGFRKLNTDGSLQSANKQYEGFISCDKFEVDSEGNEYPFYQLTMTDGIYLKDDDKIAKADALSLYSTKCTDIDDYIATKFVIHDTNRYECNPDSLTAIRNKILEKQDSMLAEVTWYEFDYVNMTEISFTTSGIVLKEVLELAEGEIDTFRDATMAGA